MKNLKFLILFFIIFFNVICSFGQNTTTNFTDINGLKQGEWIYYKVDTITEVCKPIFISKGDSAIFNDSGKTYIQTRIDSTLLMKGFYFNNLIEGEWKSYTLTKYSKERKIKSIIIFKKNKPTGEFTIYFESGNIAYQSRNIISQNKDEVLVKSFFEDGRFLKEKYLKISDILDNYSNLKLIK